MDRKQVLHEVENNDCKVMVLETVKENYEMPFYDLVVCIGNSSFVVQPKTYYSAKTRKYFSVLAKELVK